MPFTFEDFEELQNSVQVAKKGEVSAEKKLQAKYIVKGISDPDFSNQLRRRVKVNVLLMEGKKNK